MYVCIICNNWIHLSIVNNLLHFAVFTGCQIVHTNWILKAEALRMFELKHTTRIHIRTHLHTHMHTHTALSRTHVLFKLCVCRQQRSGLNCVPTVYMLISLYVLLLFMFVYFAYHISVNLCVYIATCKMFIVQLFIKYSSFIGGIKVKVLRFISPPSRRKAW